MGWYIRKAFNFGPLRLNLSRSGLGASFGVTGARVGIGPRGTYVHAGRGGLYYRQTLRSNSTRPPENIHQPVAHPVGDNFQEIASSAASSMAESSADQLLEELNRVKRHKDVFPIVMIVGIFMLVRIGSVSSDWWPTALAGVLVGFIAIVARHYDVTNGTVVVTYSLGVDAARQFNVLQAGFEQFGACRGLWHVDSSVDVSDQKRNAGAGSSERRSGTQVSITHPGKVLCNMSVPSLKAKRRVLFFFPDRVLLYDSSGVGAIPYSGLSAHAAQVRVIEHDFVPGDASRVGTTWTYVNKSGGPDRRFNNNRELPIMDYAELYIRSGSGLNEAFQCSVPAKAIQIASLITEHEKSTVSDVAVSFASAPRSGGGPMSALLWATAVAMVILTFFPQQLVILASRVPNPILMLPIFNEGTKAVGQHQTQTATIQQALTQEAQEERAQQQFTHDLAQRLIATNVEITSKNDKLFLHYVNEGPKAASRDGLLPFNKQAVFKRLLRPTTERDLCVLGFRTLVTKRDNLPLKESKLDCSRNP